MSSKVEKKHSLTPEEKIQRGIRARIRFKAIARQVINNLPWLSDAEAMELEEDGTVKVTQPKQKKDKKKSILNFEEKVLLTKPADWRTDEEKAYINRVIGGLKCFRRYPPHVKKELAGATYFLFYRPGRVIVQQGHEAHALFFILSGEIAVTQTSFDPVLNEMTTQNIGTMVSGNMFGEVSLLHNIPRTATVTTTADSELLCLKRGDFNRILKATVQKEWDLVQNAMNLFDYFKGWDEIAVRECCILSKMINYVPNETILGDSFGFPNYVYFIASGDCKLIQHLPLIVDTSKGIKQYKLYGHSHKVNVLYKSKLEKSSSKEKSEQSDSRRSSGLSNGGEQDDFVPMDDMTEMFGGERNTSFASQEITTAESKQCYPPDVEIFFMQVCILSKGACFGIGENFKNRRIVAITDVTCLLIPRYWVLQHNKANLWIRIRQYLDMQIPHTKKLFKEFKDNRRWLSYRSQLTDRLVSSRKCPNDTVIHDVPLSIRLMEQIEL